MSLLYPIDSDLRTLYNPSMPEEIPLPKNLNPADLPALEQAVLRVILRRGRAKALLEKIDL